MQQNKSVIHTFFFFCMQKYSSVNFFSKKERKTDGEKLTVQLHYQS